MGQVDGNKSASEQSQNPEHYTSNFVGNPTNCGLGAFLGQTCGPKECCPSGKTSAKLLAEELLQGGEKGGGGGRRAVRITHPDPVRQFCPSRQGGQVPGSLGGWGRLPTCEGRLAWGTAAAVGAAGRDPEPIAVAHQGFWRTVGIQTQGRGSMRVLDHSFRPWGVAPPGETALTVPRGGGTPTHPQGGPGGPGGPIGRSQHQGICSLCLFILPSLQQRLTGGS